MTVGGSSQRSVRLYEAGVDRSPWRWCVSTPD